MISSPTISNRVDDLRKDLHAAIQLRSTAFARRFDEDLVAGGGRLVYALDAALIARLFNPTDASKPEERRPADQSYRVFEGPRAPSNLRVTLEDRQSRLNQILLWYLVDGRAPYGGEGYAHLLLLPGHTVEMQKAYDAIVADFPEQPERWKFFKATAERLQEVVSTRTEGDSDAQQRALLQELTRIHFELLEPHRKFDRINELMRRRQLMGLLAASQHPNFNDTRLSPNGRSVLRLSTDAVEDDGETGSRSWWQSELNARIPSKFVANDRNALGHLDMLNKQLDATKARIILFTDNEQIIDLGRHYRPFKRDEKHPYHQLTFSDLYLRHPRSLLVDGAFLRPAASDGRGFAGPREIDGWVDTLLAAALDRTDADTDATAASQSDSKDTLAHWLEFQDRKDGMRAKIDEDARLQDALVWNRALHQRFAKQWAIHVSNLCDEHAATASLGNQDLTKTLKLADRVSAEAVQEILAETRAEVSRLTAVSWSTFFNTAAETGLELIHLPPAEKNFTVWPAPPLYVRDAPSAREMIEPFWTPTRIRRDPGEVILKLKKAGSDSLSTNYVHTLCYGLLFGLAERWTLTRLLAQRAIQISKEMKTFGDEQAPVDLQVSGREAYYLLAVAGRVTANRPAHIEQAREALAKARCIDADLAGGENADSEPLSGIRIDAEEIALDIAEYVLRLRAREPADHAVVEAFRTRILETLSRSETCQVVPVRLHVQLNLRSEFFRTLLLSEAKDYGPSVAKLSALIRKQLEGLLSVYDAHEGAPLRDRVMLRVAAVANSSLALLPDALQISTLATLDDHQASSSTRPADRRLLTRIENWITGRTSSS